MVTQVAYTESAAKTRFYDKVKTMSVVPHPSFTAVPGTTRLYSNSLLPGMCFKKVAPSTGGRGLNGLIFVTEQGGFFYVAGKSLELLAESYVSDSNNALHGFLVPKGSTGISLLSSTRSMHAYNSYFGLSSGTPLMKRPHSVSIIHEICVGLSMLSPSGPLTYTRVMEVVGNLAAGAGASLSGADHQAHFNSYGDIAPADFLSATASGAVVCGYLGRTMDMGKAKNLYGNPKVREAIIAQYPDSGGIRAKAAQLYAASVLEAGDVEVKLALIHDVRSGKLHMKKRTGHIQVTGTSQVSAGPDEAMSVIYTTGMVMPSDPPFTAPNNLRYTVPSNYGDVHQGLKRERWFLFPSEVTGYKDITGVKLGQFDMAQFQRTMLPLLTAIPDNGPLILDELEVATQFIGTGEPTDPAVTAVEVSQLRSGARSDIQKFEAFNESSTLVDNFHVETLKFLDILDAKVRNALS